MNRMASVVVLCIGCVSVAACGDDDGGIGGDGVQGNGVRGGALYDQWWSVTGAAAPTTDHPLWAARPDTMSNTRTGADTWRCKECHGWDYEGVDGAYGGGSHRTGFPGILNTMLTPGEVVLALQDTQTHAFASVLAAQDLADLAVFVTEWTVDAATYIAPDGTFMGDAAQGMPVFSSVCATCHGEQGLATMVVGGEEGFEEFPGLIANDNPQEFLHKIRFGQPGTDMPALVETMPDMLAHVGAYVQTLPQAP